MTSGSFAWSTPEYSRLIGGGRRCGLSVEAMEDMTEGGPLEGATQGLPLPIDRDRWGVDQPLVATRQPQCQCKVFC